MSFTIQGTLFDGETLRGTPVDLTVTAGRLTSTRADCPVDVSLADVQASDRLAHVPRFLHLPGNRTIETADNAAVDALLSQQRRGRLVQIVHALESHARITAVATLLLVTLTAASLWWGLPVLAYRAAMAVPATIEYQAGKAGLASFNKMLAPSSLGRRDRQKVQTQLDRLMQTGMVEGKPELEFRSMGGKFPNAFALPGGIIVISDELVQLANHDDELAAVLAHEIAHWQRRHGLQIVLRNSAALLVVATVTGDLSTLTTFAGTIPFTLLQRGYSREFETEADTHAVQLLLRANADPRYLASILKKLEGSRPTAGTDLTYLSTHPGTIQRIENVLTTAGRQGWKNPGPLSPDLPSQSARVIEKSPDVSPKALFRAAPQYPAFLRASGISGTVQVEFVIDEQGDVKDVTVVKSTREGFEAPAIAAVSVWKFEPARKNGRPVAIHASQLLEFNAHDDAPLKPSDE